AVTGTGGSGALTFSISGGALPTGLAISGAGLISGTTTAAGTFNFTVLVTDGAGGTGPKALQILINPPVVVTNAPLPGWTINRPSYNQVLAYTGGTGAPTWSITGTLPTGLTLNSATGAITGTPTVIGTSSFTAVATDSLGAIGNKALSITINLAPSISTASLPDWT